MTAMQMIEGPNHRYDAIDLAMRLFPVSSPEVVLEAAKKFEHYLKTGEINAPQS